YLKRGMLEEAMQNFNTALAYYRENDISEGIIAAWQGKVEYYLAINDYSTAYIYNDSSLQLAKETIDLNRIEQIYQSLSIISEAQGNISDALHYFRLFDAMGDSINSIEKTQMLYQLDLMGEKEKQDLAKFIRQEERNIQLRQRNTFAYVIIGLVVLAIYLVIFFRFRAKKNQVIAEQRVKQLEEEKKLLAVRFLVEGQEEERKRIATELHDGLGALLSVTKMQFTAIKDVRPENKPQYDKIAQFLEQASGDVRKISHNMMPGLLTKLGLCEALEDLFETLNDSEGMDARLEIVGPKERLPENKEIMIYRIIQEIVNNSLKHANANKIDLTIIVHPDQLDISCSDNGIGFDRDRILGKKTIGIQSIHSRVKFLDGNICIDSSPGNGTVYRINIPLEPKH
ncbi:MAG TPA: sensor histidine kinase, partial [Bacteroidales bacterium]|nr:sensor histidine kinase [Bacteroidales bacterium]